MQESNAESEALGNGVLFLFIFIVIFIDPWITRIIFWFNARIFFCFLSGILCFGVRLSSVTLFYWHGITRLLFGILLNCTVIHGLIISFWVHKAASHTNDCNRSTGCEAASTRYQSLIGSGDLTHKSSTRMLVLRLQKA